MPTTPSWRCARCTRCMIWTSKRIANSAKGAFYSLLATHDSLLSTRRAMSPPVSYAQRFEDLYLMRCFGDRSDGFYIDIGSGHPVYDNMSFAFYLKGWHGITVEPNPRLARLSRAVRPRDRHVEAVVGAT